MPTVNERCKILRSVNRVYVFEIVLLLVPRLKILQGLSIWDYGFRILRNKDAKGHKSSSQETNHNTPLLRTKSICFFADTNCEAYQAPLDLGTNDMGALHIKHRTL